ncbi:hypothetical protein J6590_089121 [Homalodisca vitripennis]|nr:hypothetical protein J6590_089121 [Homalodisca vitripennis]
MSPPNGGITAILHKRLQSATGVRNPYLFPRSHFNVINTDHKLTKLSSTSSTVKIILNHFYIQSSTSIEQCTTKREGQRSCNCLSSVIKTAATTGIAYHPLSKPLQPQANTLLFTFEYMEHLFKQHFIHYYSGLVHPVSSTSSYYVCSSSMKNEDNR